MRTLRHVFRDIFRRGRQSMILIAAVCLLFTLLLVSAAITVSNEAMISDIYKNYKLKAEFVPVDETEIEGWYHLSFAESFLKHEEFIESYNYTRLFPVRLATADKPGNEMFAQNSSLVTELKMTERFSDTNDDVEFLEGWGWDCMSKQDAVVVISRRLAEDLGVGLGDKLLIHQDIPESSYEFDPNYEVLLSNLKASITEFTVAGLFDGAEPDSEQNPQSAYELYIPGSFLDTLDVSSRYKMLSLAFDRAEFILKNIDRLHDFKTALSEPDVINARYRFVIFDDQLNRTIDALSGSIKFMETVVSALYILAMAVAFIVSLLLLKMRTRDIALKIAVGVSVPRIGLTMLLEFALLCLVGIALGLGLSAVVAGRVISSAIPPSESLPSALLFLLMFSAGTASSLLSIVSLKPMVILTKRDS